nr:polyketide cyclase [Mycolicibacterium malmesburyense]CRL71874.1 polyketide cyclase/dehydrase and lipid transport [Mycolicibacterium malmesburyense]
MESRHVSTWIAASPETVYEFAADPRTWPKWAAGLAEGGLRQTSEGWVADSPMGEVTVEFPPPNDLGVLDHVVRLPSGEAVYNPMRVQPWSVPADADDPRCEVVFSVRRRPGMTEEEFDADAEAVAADLATLKRLIED